MNSSAVSSSFDYWSGLYNGVNSRLRRFSCLDFTIIFEIASACWWQSDDLTFILFMLVTDAVSSSSFGGVAEVTNGRAA